eukprot:m51a1_g7657 hypothetical protein (1525) ;mRNA; f:406804-411463
MTAVHINPGDWEDLILRSDQFQEVFHWIHDVEARAAAFVPEVDLEQLPANTVVLLAIRSLYKVLSGKTLARDVAHTAPQLLEMSRPAEISTVLEIAGQLITYHEPSDQGTQQSYLMSVIEYQLRLDQVARALNLSEAVQIRLYWHRFGKGLVRRRLYDRLDLEQENLETIKKVTIDIVRAEDVLISCGYTYKSGPKGRPDNDRKKPDRQSKKEPRRDETSKPKQATSMTPAAAASSMTHVPLAKSEFGRFEILEDGTVRTFLTSKDRDKLSADRRCFVCGSKGHGKMKCQAVKRQTSMNKKGTFSTPFVQTLLCQVIEIPTPRKAPRTPTNPTKVPVGAIDTPDDGGALSVQLSQLEQGDRVRATTRNGPGAKQGPDTIEKLTTTDGSDIEDVNPYTTLNPKEFELCDVEDELIYEPPSAIKERHIYVKANVGAGPLSSLECQIDPGADRSFVNEKFAANLKNYIRRLHHPIKFKNSNGSVDLIALAAFIPLAFEQGAPFQDVVVFVMPMTPAGDFVLIGLRDTQHYVISLMTPPVITYNKLVRDELAADPIDIPMPNITRTFKKGTMPPIKLGPLITENPQWCTKFTELFTEFSDVCDPLDNQPAQLPQKFHIDILEGANVPYESDRVLSDTKKAFVKSELDKYEAIGIYVKDATIRKKEATPITVAESSPGVFRMCGDYHKKNTITVKIKYPMWYTRDVIKFCSGKQYRAKFDWKRGYWQGENDEETFRMQSSTLNYIDDCIEAATTLEELYLYTRKFLEVCRKLHIKLNTEKCEIRFPKTHILGCIVTEDSVEVDMKRLAPLRDAVFPFTMSMLQSFLGFAQWLAPFISNYTDVVAPLWELLTSTRRRALDEGKGSKHTLVQHTASTEEAFNKVITALLTPAILAQPIPGATIVIHPDACEYGIEGAVLQRDPEMGELRILLLCSHKLTIGERQQMTTGEKEAYATVFLVQKARPYISGPLVVCPDHNNLRWMETSVNRHILHWTVILSEFDYVIVFQPGEQNFIGDYFSRSFPLKKGEQYISWQPGKVVESHLVEIAEKENVENFLVDMVGDDGQGCKDRDNVIEAVQASIENLPYELVDNVIILNERPSMKVLVRLFVLGHSHPMAGHGGVQRTMCHISAAIKWPGMEGDVARMVRECPACQKEHAKHPHSTDMGTTVAHNPFDSVFLDYIGPFQESRGCKYILVMIDRFSHWVVLEPMAMTQGEPTAEVVWKRWLCIHGLVDQFYSDGAKEFMAGAFIEMCRVLHIRHHVSLPLHPEGHGAVEHKNLYIESTLRCVMHKENTTNSWADIVAPVALAINCSYSRTLGTTLWNVVHGFAPQLPINVAMPDTTTGNEPLSVAAQTAIQAASLLPRVHEIQEALGKEIEATYRARAKGQIDFAVGDYVLVHFKRKTKLGFSWKGPEIVVSRDHRLIYTTESLIDHVQSKVHVNRLHQFWPGTLSLEELTAEAVNENEYLIEKIYTHKRQGTKLYFRLKYLGYPDVEDDHPDAWNEYQDVRWSPVVQEYMRVHKLRKPRIPKG